MAETPSAPGTTPVSDHRPVPRGVLPLGIQTWLMVGLAGGMLLIILVAGRPTPSPRQATTAPVPAPSPDRVRDYQQRLRALEAQAMQEDQSAPSSAAPSSSNPERQSTAGEDALAAERKRRDYESRFASNIAFSRRSGTDKPGGAEATAGPTPTAERSGGTSPSIDEVADAVVRATARVNRAVATPPLSVQASESVAANESQPAPTQRSPRAGRTAPISAAGSVHRLPEGTLIDTALTNELEGSMAGPVKCLVTTDVYSPDGQHVLIPRGAFVLGQSKPVQATGETRLAVAFHRLVWPDGRTTYSLDQYPGLNQNGDAGLHDRVNQHYWSIFGAAAAVGLVNGFAQAVGAASANVGNGDRTVIVSGGAAESTAQATMQVMNRFLNRLPTVTIRKGHRVQIYLTSDLDLPVYEASQLPRAF